MQLKGVLMAVYFGADHVVWAGQAGLVANKQLLERWRRFSFPSHCARREERNEYIYSTRLGLVRC